MLLNPETGEFLITGTSFSNHSVEFYEPIIDFFDQYANNPTSVSTLTIKLVHRNSATDKCMIQVLESLAEAHNQKSKVIVKWHYAADDDDEELDYVKSLASNINVIFEYIPY